MTEPERAALDHIRQVVDSILGAPAASVSPEPNPAEPVASGPLVFTLPVPYLSEMGQATGTAPNDSGAAAGVTLVRAYTGQAIRPGDFYNQAGQGGNSPLSFTQILNAMSMNGVPVELRSNLKFTDLSLILFSGRPVIVPLRLAVLEKAGLSLENFDGPYYMVVVGMDVKQVFIHDPLRADPSGSAQGVPWQIFYQAWTQARGYERAVLVPRQQLIRRVRVTATSLNVHDQPSESTSPVGRVEMGDLFEITAQKNGWGKIGEERWINLSYAADI